MGNEISGKYCRSFETVREGVRNRIMALVMAVIILIGFIVIVLALTTEEHYALQDKLDNLESSLSESGYGWLINYSEINGGNVNDK